MSSNDIAIRVTNLGKCYEIYGAPRDRLKQFVMPRLQRLAGRSPKQYFREFWALKDVSFEIKKGETVGIIGRNGSGKSTLLQMICGTLNPTSGSIQTNGRIAALLELGSGFNPEFTGRENVYMNASVLGLSNEEIASRFNDIVVFADISDFIEQPVKTYSSGMMVRLAFAVIAHVDADILVVDEALAVGDVFFQQKCMRYLRNFKEKGGSLLFVSHDTPTVMALCDRAVLIRQFSEGDHFFQQGNVEQICRVYLSDLYSDVSRSNAIQQIGLRHEARELNSRSIPAVGESIAGNMSQKSRYFVSAFDQKADSFGERGGLIVSAEFRDSNGLRLSAIEGDQQVTLVMKIRAVVPLQWPLVGVILKDRQGQFLFTEGTDTHFRDIDLGLQSEGEAEVFFSFRMPCLLRGNYTLDLAFANGIGDDHVQHHWMHDAIRIECTEGRHVHGIVGFSDLDIVWQK
jgi:lipopolysaccharide transport system ATP-binding protein